MKYSKFIRFYALIVLAFTSTFASAQNSQRVYQSHKRDKNKLEITTNDGAYYISFYNQNIVETTFLPEGESFSKSPDAVVLKPEDTNAVLTVSDTSLIYKTPGIAVEVIKNPFQISYSYKGNHLLSERNGYVKTDSTENIDFNIDADEVLFGGGSRALGMDRRGNRLQLYNRAHYGYGTRSELMSYSMPVVISSKIYAVHFDNAPIGYLDLDSKKTNTLRYETINGRKTYQVIATDSRQDLTYQFTNLTGRQPMLPRWALGNFASRFGYHSQKETIETIDQFLKDSIPVDAIILDLYWFGKNMKGDMGNLAFDQDSFPTPQKMTADLDAKGVKTILITEPFILTTSNRWDEAVKEKILGTDSIGQPYTYDFFFGNTGLIDIFKPEAVDWFWNIYKNEIKKGIEGWWGDLGEPEIHPSGLHHVKGTADEVHNIYGHYWAKMIYEGYRKDFPNKRPFILMRAGAVGSQRYGMVPWTGDVSRSWDGLKPQTEISLQMGLQGIAYMHSDLGGFAEANLDDELYTRWLQYGVFQPIFRPHAQEEIPSEPIFREPKTKALAKKSIELRYRLLPYNYTLTFENNQTGMPLMRPLFFEEPDNPDLLNISDTYLWGDAFLVSTITNRGIKEKQIYLPDNNTWFDFFTDKKYKGGEVYEVAVEEDHIPVFVRAGAFVPMIKGIQTTRDYTMKTFELHYYHDKLVSESKGQLYDDDGETPEAYEKGKFELITFTSRFERQDLDIVILSNLGENFQSVNHNTQLCVHNIMKEPGKVLFNDKKIPFTWDSTSKILKFKGNVKGGTTQKFTIKL